jgi:hypothetical protein
MAIVEGGSRFVRSAFAGTLVVASIAFYATAQSTSPNPAEKPSARAGAKPAAGSLASPGPRRAASMTFDEARKVVLLFGGASPARSAATSGASAPAAGAAPPGSTQHGTLWSWDGKSWKQVAADGPSPRVHGCFVYDAKRQRAVLYGGSSGDYPDERFLEDTWEWDGKQWTQAAEKGPGRRAHCACAWDPARERVVLFGGLDMTSGKEFGDVWQWDGRQWQAVESRAPTIAYAPALFFDAAAKSMVLVCVDPESTKMNTSAWNGKEFVELGEEGPVALPAAIVALGRKGGALAFAGYDGKEIVAQTWRLAQEAWSRVDVPGPSPRGSVAMAYDAARDRVVLFGGEDKTTTFDDTWEFDGRAWKQVAR